MAGGIAGSLFKRAWISEGMLRLSGVLTIGIPYCDTMWEGDGELCV